MSDWKKIDPESLEVVMPGYENGYVEFSVKRPGEEQRIFISEKAAQTIAIMNLTKLLRGRVL